ncbi:MAG: hypothetical protein ACJA08_002471 [Cyclobacteriaceae bacterium]|jgi:hypothetical protein
MKKLLLILPLLICLSSCNAQPKEIPNKEWQIKTAVLPLEESLQPRAKVLGFDIEGKIVVIREGKNDMICLADDPAKEGFSVAAYHKDLEPFMTRGRELKAQALSFQEIFDLREKEVSEGKLIMPDKSTLYVMNGELDENGEPINTKLRFVIYIPYATAESTGLPVAPPVPGAPWIMNPGTHRAHIMVTPNYEAE